MHHVVIVNVWVSNWVARRFRGSWVQGAHSIVFIGDPHGYHITMVIILTVLVVMFVVVVVVCGRWVVGRQGR